MTTDSKPYFSDIGCIIMASGEGKRFGANKLMADFGGKPLISHIIDTAKSVFKNIVVVTRHRDVDILCQNMGINVVYHSMPGRNDTVRLGLEYFKDKFNGYIFCQGDQPLLTADTLVNMVREFEKDKDKIIRLQYDNTPCSPVIFPNWCCSELTNLPQGKGGNVVVKSHPDKVVYITAHRKEETIDIDTPDNLEELKKYINI